MFCPLAMARCREPLGIGESRMERRSGGGEKQKADVSSGSSVAYLVSLTSPATRWRWASQQQAFG